MTMNLKMTYDLLLTQALHYYFSYKERPPNGEQNWHQKQKISDPYILADSVLFMVFIQKRTNTKMVYIKMTSKNPKHIF